LILRRDGTVLRLFTHRGYGWTERYPAIVNTAARFRANSLFVDDIAVCDVAANSAMRTKP
jgi:ATP-dependent DNA ligase